MNCPFLTFTARPVAAGRHQQIRLASERKRDLQQFAHCGNPFRLPGFVNVG